MTLCLALQTVHGAGVWRAEFDETCAKTDDAMTLAIEELTSLIENCTRLEKAVSSEEETVRKVYLRRLQMCKNLYIFVRESKQLEVQPK
ncbi:MAG: hypothetical protein EHM51_00425 [Geobacter sp.]|nr:MAG: hypothetical protein EHM51_00425 [Geobacter sp.]